MAMRNLDTKSGTSGGFIHDEAGQDLLEYALLLAFIGLAGAAALLNMSGSTNTLWSVANSNLAAANSGS
jgi:Flp pilus assembly pilin Flp